MHPAIKEMRQVKTNLPELWFNPQKFYNSPGCREKADAAKKGILYFDSRPVCTGTENIDWSGKHIAHQEWPAQLNRFYQLSPLMACYKITGDASYAETAALYIKDWIQHHSPYSLEGRPAQRDSSLNMPIRLGSLNPSWVGWLCTLEIAYGSKFFDDSFINKVLSSIDWQLEWLRNNLAREGNWRIAALSCHLQMSLQIPSRYGKYLTFARDSLINEFYSQILEDGTHIERSAGYHDWMAATFLLFSKIGKKLGENGWELEPQRVLNMDFHSLSHTLPHGGISRFNDSSGSISSIKNNRILDRRIANHKALRKQYGISGTIPCDGIFSGAGLVFFRDSWRSDTDYLAFDSSTSHGGGHSHLSRLALEFCHKGRTLIPDPGIFSYEMSKWQAVAGKKTSAHSTMNVNMLNQSDTGARLLQAFGGKKFGFAHGRYTGGYWDGTYKWAFNEGRGRGTFGIHDRCLLWLKGRYIVIFDFLVTDPGNTVYSHWQMDDSPYRRISGRQVLHTCNPKTNILIEMIPVIPENSPSLKIFRGDKKTHLGFIGLPEDKVIPAPLVSWSWEEKVVECITLIIPYETRVLEYSVKSEILKDTPSSRVFVLHIGERTDTIFWTRELNDSLGTFSWNGKCMSFPKISLQVLTNKGRNTVPLLSVPPLQPGKTRRVKDPLLLGTEGKRKS